MIEKNNILYVTGARRNKEEFSTDKFSSCYDAGIFEINFSKKTIVREYIENKANKEIYVPEYTLSFRGGCIHRGSLMTCNHSEIVTLNINDFTITNRITNNNFNDLHCVQYFKGEKWVVSTGIDMAIKLSGDNSVELFPVNGSASNVYNEKLDYRNICTKPHGSHPNFLFATDDGVWATRFKERDAVLLTDPDKTINVNVERPHDGVVRGGSVFFTTVDGCVVESDIKTGNVIKVYDIKANNSSAERGWCRGLCVEGDYLYVGFTVIRHSKNIERLSYVTDTLRVLGDKLKNKFPARIVKYNLKKERIEDEMRFKLSEIGVIFSILK